MILEILAEKEPFLMLIQSDYNEKDTIKLLREVHGIIVVSTLEFDADTVEENDIEESDIDIKIERL